MLMGPFFYTPQVSWDRGKRDQRECMLKCVRAFVVVSIRRHLCFNIQPESIRLILDLISIGAVLMYLFKSETIYLGIGGCI